MVGQGGGLKVAKKKADGQEAKRYGSHLRVSDAFLDAVRKVTTLEGRSSAAEFCDSVLLPIVEERYRELLALEAKKMGPKGRK